MNIHNMIGGSRLFPIDRKDPSLVLYLPLWYPRSDMTGSTIYSYDNNRHTGTVTGATWGTRGRTFVGGNPDYIEATISQLNFTTGDFTAGIWFKTSDVTTAQWLFNRGEFQADGYYILIQNSWVQATSHQVGANQDRYTQAILTANNYHHVVVIRQGDINFVVDGVLQSNLQGSAWQNPTTSARTLKIGARDDKASGPYSGLVGEICVWNRAFSIGEAQSYYQSTKWRYT